MKIKQLEISNILSVESLSLSFEDEGLILVDGENGAGKSAIFNALSFAIYGKVPRKISISKVLKHGAKKGYAKAVIQIENTLYSVIRYRPLKVEYYKDDLLLDISQEEFEDQIRCSYDQFLLSMYSSQADKKKFIYLNDTEKKEFFLKLMNLSDFSLYKSKVDKKKKILEQKLLTVNNAIIKVDNSIEIFTDALAKPLPKIDNNELETLIQQRKDISITPVDISKYREAIDVLNNKNNELNQYKLQENTLFIKKNNLQTAPSISCPSCNSEIILNKNPLLSSELEQKIQDIDKKLAEIPDYQLEIQKNLANINKINKRIEKELNNYNALQQQANKLDILISQKEASKQAYLDKKQEQETIKLKISTNTDNLNKLKQAKEKLSKEIELLSTISAMFSPQGAQAYIMDSLLESFNLAVSKYVDLIWPNASYEIKSFKENSKGEIKTKFSEHVIIDGKDKAIGALSGGEQKSLSLIADFAIIDILESNCNIKVNPVILDEPFDALDVSNRAKAMDVLESMSRHRQIYVIDHGSESKAGFSKVLRVKKSNNTTILV